MLESTAVPEVILSISILLYACYTDIKRYEVDDWVWVILGGAGATLSMVAIFLRELEPLTYLTSILITTIVVISLGVLSDRGVIEVFGWGDVKGLIALSLALPVRPSPGIEGLPLIDTPQYADSFFTLSLFVNAVIISSLLVFYLLIRSALAGTVEKRSLRGYPLCISSITSFHNIELLERPIRQKRRISLEPAEPHEPTEEEVAMLYELASEAPTNGKCPMIWVTPKLPFMIPITAGLILDLVVGDLFTAIVVAIVSLL
ncbi:MAG: A24 family peptidase [Methermicoccaceae archaeon]